MLEMPPSLTDPAQENRRRQLRRWIDTHYGSSQSLFIEATNDGQKQVNQGELSGLLRTKSFGERRARSLEQQAKMPPGYLDQSEDAPTPALLATERQPGESQPPPTHGWPFSRVTLARLMTLKKQLGPHKGVTAMQDIDETLELTIMKWERRVIEKSAA